VRWARRSPADVESQWDAELQQFTDRSLYQSSRWGRYKRIRGWTPEYFHLEANGKTVGMLQALVRTYPLRTVVAWCPGGPVGVPEACSRESMEQLSSILHARSLYCRSSLLRAKTIQDEQYLQSNGWVRPGRTVSANLTAVWDLRQTEEQLLAGLNRNWRYSLRQAQKSNLTIDRLVVPPIQELTDLCREMNASKGVPAAIRSSDVAALFDALGDQVLVYGCRNASGQLIAFHSCAIQGQRAWELVAATSAEGRRNGASFAVLWALILHCRRLNVTHYDLAGIDPVKAPGVANFKRWTGAQDVEWLGEWEWSTSSGLRHAVNLAVRHRADAALP
jgi:lipid II:glycine glycyltransferase (peptidoglycan interpeptide bridge formation enzyme)